MKRVIVPLFISHQGCPHHCIFCDQRKISGASGVLPEAGELLEKVAQWQKSAGGNPVEVAFYGGSFTALPVRDQEKLLQPLQPLIERGEIAAVRVSTRPDAVSASAAELLRSFGVGLVELGVQTMDDDLLAGAGRGHTSRDTERAFAILRRAGLKVGAQMMPGLPGDTPEKSLCSFGDILRLRPDTIRIYPAVVLTGTGLARLYETGRYIPLSLEAAVSLCRVMLHDAALAGIPVIRVGLQPTDDLSFGSEVLAGPYHPALRQLVEGERWYDLLCLILHKASRGAAVGIRCASSRVSDVVGQKRSTIRRLEKKHGILFRDIRAESALASNDIRVEISGRIVAANILQDLKYDGLIPSSRRKFD